MTEPPPWDTVERLLRAPQREDLPEIRALTGQAMAASLEDDDIGCGDALYGLCFLLYLVGDPEDVALIYDAKHINMDTGSMIDSALLTMGRDHATMLRIVAALSETRPDLVDDLNAAFSAPSYDSPERSWRRSPATSVFDSSARGSSLAGQPTSAIGAGPAAPSRRASACRGAIDVT